MSSTMASLTMVLSVAFTGVLVEWIARARHPRRLFFIGLGRERTDADERRARRLRVANACITAAAVALMFVPGPEWLAAAGATGGPLLSATWLVVETMLAARTATRERVPGRWMVSLEAPPSVLEYVSAPLQVLNVLVFLIPCALFAWLRSQLPDSIPAHWNAAGEIDRWGSPSELWMMAGIMLFDLALLWGIVLAVAKERWALPEKDAETYRVLQMERRRLMVRMLEWLFLALDAGMAVIWMAIAFGSLHGGPDTVTSYVLVGVVFSLVGSIVPLAVFAPRLVQVADDMRKVAGTAVLGTHPSGWRFSGMIYYAPEDPAVFVPKRDGIGQTINMARPWAWIFVAAVTVLPIAISLVALVLAD